jgi:hypothetical protein
MRVKRFLLWFNLTLLFAGLSAQGQVKYPDLTHEGYRNLQSAVEKILEECPTKDCLPVFLGRSNVLMSAYMDAHQIANVSLPASGLRHIDERSTKAAYQAFTSKVVDPILKPKLNGIKKIALVDYIHQGGSVTRASLWLKEYLQKSSKNLSVKVLGYGKTLQPEYLAKLFAQQIEVKYIPAGNSSLRGSPAYLAKESQVESYAAFGSWEPGSGNPVPEFDSKLRRHYPYYDRENVKLYSEYASYDDLVELFKKENPIEHLPKPIDSCNQWMRGFIN